MASQAEKYRVHGHELNDTFFNARFLDIDLRLVKLETQIGQIDEATDALIQRGLDNINTQLQAAIAALQGGVDEAQAAVTAVNAALTDLEESVAEIVGGVAFPAEFTTIDEVAGLAAENVQDAIEELVVSRDTLQGAVDTISDELGDLQNQVNGLGDVITVDDLTAAAALTGLDRGDVIHVLDNGSSKWVRYQVTVAGDGTWAGATKVVIFTQDQAPSSHVHVVGDVTGLQTALDGKVGAARQVATSGLATGGGALSTDRTIDVQKSSAAQYRAGTSDAVALTPKAVVDGMAEIALSDAATIDWDLATGFDFVVTLGGNRTLANLTNPLVGKKGRLRVVQDGTGGRTLSFAAHYKFGYGLAPVLSPAPYANDVLYYDVVAANFIVISPLKDVK